MANVEGMKPMIQITLSRVAGASNFRQVALHEGKVVGAGKAPFLNACRWLVENGYSSDVLVECRWEGSGMVSFSGPLSSFIKWTVKENEKHGPSLVEWRPYEIGER